MIEVNTNNAAVETSGIYSNPLGAINRSWNEAVMNASMESVLTGFGDPRIAKFFEPCADDLVITDDGGESVSVPLKGQYHGIRQGTAFSHNYYAAFSRLTVEPTTEVVLMSAAEVWFLRAEAALRGWTDEDAGTCYRAGVSISFAQWQVSGAEQYLENDASAADYRDPIAPENDIAARCRVSPRWDESRPPRSNSNGSSPKSGSPCIPKAAKLGPSSGGRVIRVCFRCASTIARARASTPRR